VMALQTRAPYYGLRTNINTREIVKTSRMVSNYTGIHVQPNKAIVGSNAFAHEAGIHQDGMLKNSSTYEIMTPESVGWAQSKLVLGKHSGRHALKVRLEELGYQIEGDGLNQVFERFKALADAKKTVTDADLQALIADEFHGPEEVFKLEDIQVTCGTMGMPTATVKLSNVDGEMFIHAAVGTGPVHAAYRAIDEVTKAPNELMEYSVHSVTEGIAALGEVTVRIAPPNSKRSFGGYGADADIVVASVKAYLAAVNRMITALGYGNRKPEGDAATVKVASGSN
jgi:2-isopropylmalate synthase